MNPCENADLEKNTSDLPGQAVFHSFWYYPRKNAKLHTREDTEHGSVGLTERCRLLLSRDL